MADQQMLDPSMSWLAQSPPQGGLVQPQGAGQLHPDLLSPEKKVRDSAWSKAKKAMGDAWDTLVSAKLPDVDDKNRFSSSLPTMPSLKPDEGMRGPPADYKMSTGPGYPKLLSMLDDAMAPGGKAQPGPPRSAMMMPAATDDPGRGGKTNGVAVPASMADMQGFYDAYKKSEGQRVGGSADAAFAGGNSEGGGVGPGGGAQKNRDAPVVHMASQLGTPSSPSKTNGRQPSTFLPQDEGGFLPASYQPGGQPSQQPGYKAPTDDTIKSIRGMIDQMDQKGGGRMDLTPLLALSDSWSGGHLAQAYDRPLTERERTQMKNQLAENLAKRQSDLEWHRDRVEAQMARVGVEDKKADYGHQDKQESIGAGLTRNENSVAGKVAVANIQAGAKKDVMTMKGQQASDPGIPGSAASNRLFNQNKGLLKVVGQASGVPTRDVTGKPVDAAGYAHHMIMAAAQRRMQNDPAAYGSLEDAYAATLRDHATVARKPAGGSGGGSGSGDND